MATNGCITEILERPPADAAKRSTKGLHSSPQPSNDGKLASACNQHRHGPPGKTARYGTARDVRTGSENFPGFWTQDFGLAPQPVDGP
jgi:hypothetical protein